jgi:hypothetical protein
VGEKFRTPITSKAGIMVQAGLGVNVISYLKITKVTKGWELKRLECLTNKHEP